MLYYTEVDLSTLEVPGETSICIYISGCQNHCANCHYPELRQNHYGDLLRRYFRDVISLYILRASCVCFLGEGANTQEEQEEFQVYCEEAHRFGFCTCLYSGRDTGIEPWMNGFDYIKLGSYQEKLGPLSSPATNQRMYQKNGAHYFDITHRFWNEIRYNPKEEE